MSERAQDRIDTLREALEDMVEQFADQYEEKGHKYLSAYGLSALKGAFAALGWDDPHIIEELVQ